MHQPQEHHAGGRLAPTCPSLLCLGTRYSLKTLEQERRVTSRQLRAQGRPDHTKIRPVQAQNSPLFACSPVSLSVLPWRRQAHNQRGGAADTDRVSLFFVQDALAGPDESPTQAPPPPRAVCVSLPPRVATRASSGLPALVGSIDLRDGRGEESWWIFVGKGRHARSREADGMKRRLMSHS